MSRRALIGRERKDQVEPKDANEMTVAIAQAMAADPLGYARDMRFDMTDLAESRRFNYGGMKLDGCVVQGLRATNPRIRDMEFKNCNVQTGTFVDVDGEGADMEATVFDAVLFTKHQPPGLPIPPTKNSMKGANLANTLWRGCRLSGMDFTEANLNGARFENCTLVEVDFTDTDMTNANLDRSFLADCTFEGTNLHAAEMRWGYISGGVFNPSAMNFGAHGLCARWLYERATTDEQRTYGAALALNSHICNEFGGNANPFPAGPIRQWAYGTVQAAYRPGIDTLPDFLETYISSNEWQAV